MEYKLPSGKTLIKINKGSLVIGTAQRATLISDKFSWKNWRIIYRTSVSINNAACTIVTQYWKLSKNLKRSFQRS